MIEKILKKLKQLIPEDEIQDRGKHYTIPTICHNENHQDASHKLYLYKNEDSVPLFHCYTECGETFNIYQLLQKYYALRGKEITYREAYKEVNGKDYVGDKKESSKQIEQKIEKISFKNPLEINLKEYNSKILDLFSIKETHPWRMEGIDPLILQKYKVGYSKSMEVVSIPHRDWRGRVVGIRVRNFNEQAMKIGKYLPLKMGDDFYSHPLSLNFYGIFENQSTIKKKKRVIIAESEKSVLQYEEMFGEGICLAICGQTISKWHMDMLIFFLGVEEVVIAFDKEYTDFSERFDYIKNIKNKLSYLNLYTNIKILVDEENIFRQKESPFDRTKADFLRLKEVNI